MRCCLRLIAGNKSRRPTPPALMATTLPPRRSPQVEAQLRVRGGRVVGLFVLGTLLGVCLAKVGIILTAIVLALLGIVLGIALSL